MHYKGIQDTIFECQACGRSIPFKGYSFNHKYCNTKCQHDHRSSLVTERNRVLFDRGELTTRRDIFPLLVQRDGNCCSECKITEWRGKPIRFWVDHIDGDSTNNQPSNFRLICPNCDSQSITFGAKNRGSGRKSRGLKMYD